MVLFISAVMWSEVLTVIPAAEQQRFNEKQHVSFPLCLHVESWEMYSTLAWVPGLIITPLFSDIGNFGSQYTFLKRLDWVFPCCSLLIVMVIVSTLTDKWQEGSGTEPCQALGLHYCSVFVILAVSVFIQPNKSWRMRGQLPLAAPGTSVHQCLSVPHIGRMGHQTRGQL